MDAACRSAVPYLEIDTRVSRDGEIFVHHDPATGRGMSHRRAFAASSAAEMAEVRFPTGEPLMTLRDALARFAGRRHESQRLCIDIKDHGFEAGHLRLVREAHLEDAVRWVSWIPQSLLALREMGARSPLVLSHTNLLDAGLLGHIGALHGRRISRFGRYVVVGHTHHATPLLHHSHGFQHTLLCKELPAPLAEVLAGSGGGVCVHRSRAGRLLSAYCSDAGLQLWVFSVTRVDDFRRWAAEPRVDVVFCDDAPAVERALVGARGVNATAVQ